MTASNTTASPINYVNPASKIHPTIPWINMDLFIHGSPEEQITAALQFGSAFQEIGFVAVTNIGILPETIDRAFTFAEDFFSRSEEFKLRVRSPDGHYGFIPFGTEHAKYTHISDLKEFYQTTGPTQPEHLWPDIAEFKSAVNALYFELENCLRYCLQATAIYLGYTGSQRTILSDLLGSGNGLMRMLHYPSIGKKASIPGAIRSAPHEDVSLMTVMPRATGPGLQIKNHLGDWLDVTVPDNAAIINAGDTLSYITNGIIPSTTHRVVNPDSKDDSARYSIPFFGSLPFNTVLRVLDKCRCQMNMCNLPKQITFGEFLLKRYKDIGLKS